MSLLSLLGIISFLVMLLLYYSGIKQLKGNEGKIIIQIYYIMLTIVIVTEIVLAWNVGPGCYKFWN
jgi:preprotein translocase subunit SecD